MKDYVRKRDVVKYLAASNGVPYSRLKVIFGKNVGLLLRELRRVGQVYFIQNPEDRRERIWYVRK